METPSFEKPEVWATEIAAVNGLSGAGADDAGLGSIVDSVREVVWKAGGNTGASSKTKTKKAPKKPAAKKGRKKPKQGDSDPEGEYSG